MNSIEIVKPNLCQLYASYVLTDPKYEVLPEEQNISTLLEILEADDVREDDESND